MRVTLASFNSGHFTLQSKQNISTFSPYWKKLYHTMSDLDPSKTRRERTEMERRKKKRGKESDST
jgi:hypothetical protein